MMVFGNNNEVLKKINLLRQELEENLSKADKPTEVDIVKISQELDELIVDYYKQIEYME